MFMAEKQEEAGRQGGNRTHTQVLRRARCTLDRAVRAGASCYDRRRDLPRLIRIDPYPETSDTAESVKAILARLERALRAERCRARSGHWTYDLNRHIALRQAYLAEAERLLAIKAGGR
jgi:hypothetical protein